MSKKSKLDTFLETISTQMLSENWSKRENPRFLGKQLLESLLESLKDEQTFQKALKSTSYRGNYTFRGIEARRDGFHLSIESPFGDMLHYILEVNVKPVIPKDVEERQ